MTERRGRSVAMSERELGGAVRDQVVLLRSPSRLAAGRKGVVYTWGRNYRGSRYNATQTLLGRAGLGKLMLAPP